MRISTILISMWHSLHLDVHVFVDTRTLAICADEDTRKDRGRARSVVQVVRLCCINHVTVSYPSRESTSSAGPHHLGYIQIPRSQFQPFFFHYIYCLERFMHHFTALFHCAIMYKNYQGLAKSRGMKRKHGNTEAPKYEL